ncbi:hypothetical protein Saso_18580 [Streptomyces asoensis]|uniref:Uncharacterized protein n=1 Tax=Streptomyces asoensis TaxID=249586 RepID=A0ABQ3RWI4_9ACTN|nr:hypothetical protein Saso_18580 [Streptomyces asoensis]
MREETEGLPETDRTVAMDPLSKEPGVLRRGRAPRWGRAVMSTGRVRAVRPLNGPVAGRRDSWCGMYSGRPNSRTVRAPANTGM